ncbi:hypothetical protein ACLOJK_022712 [Asimina triloba]
MEIIKLQSGEKQPWPFAKLTIFLQIQNVERHPGVHANRDSVHRWTMAAHLELDSKRTSKNSGPMEDPQPWAALGDDSNLTASAGPRSQSSGRSRWAPFRAKLQTADTRNLVSIEHDEARQQPAICPYLIR